MSDAAHEQISPEDEEARQRQLRTQLETWAARRVKPWGKLQPDDYDFRSWAKKASENCLHAGAVYEYARESRKLRWLVALMNPKRPREEWEKVSPGLIDGKTPTGDEIDTYPEKAYWLPCLFENLNEHDAERVLGGFLYCLADLANDLADNTSFSELLRTKPKELEKAFGGLNKLARVEKEFRYFWPLFDAVEVATRSEAGQATVLETISCDKQRLIHGEACSEVIAIRVRWRFTNSEIAAGIKKFVCALRPRNDAYKARRLKKGSRRDSVRSALDCLSAMRLASYLPKTSPPPTPGALSAWQSGASAELKESAIDVFDMVRLGGRDKPMAESNFDALIVQARRVFRKSFPYGEDAANAATFKDRIMMKSERISS